MEKKQKKKAASALRSKDVTRSVRKSMMRRFSCLMVLAVMGFGAVATALVADFIAAGCGRTDDGDPDAKGALAYDTAWIHNLDNAASDFEDESKMDAQIRRFMSKWGLRGLQVAVTRHDSLVFAKGYGMADAEAGQPMQPTTIMRIASASKLVTAVAIMKLVEEGKISLNSKVFGPKGILNDTVFTAAVADKRIFDITVDHLLMHEGGFSRAAGDPMFRTREIVRANHLSDAPDPRTLTEIILRRKLSFDPGTSSHYSNFGYMLLSLVVEEASGQNYWDYVTDHVLLPAGVSDMRAGTNYLHERYDNEAHYYSPDDEPVEAFDGSGLLVDRVYGGNDIRGLLGAGGWLASAPGLARLTAAIDGRPGVDDILTPQTVRKMAEKDGDDYLCRGWVAVDSRGNRIRTGTLSSSHAMIKQYTDGETWVFLTNSGVWTGFHFTNNFSKLADDLRPQPFPARNLW